MSQPVQDQQTILDWEQFFRDHRRIDRVVLTLMTPRKFDEPRLSVEVTVFRDILEERQDTSKVTISTNAPGAGDSISLTANPYCLHELAEMLDEADLLSYELRSAFRKSQQPRTASRRRKKPAAAVREGSEKGPGTT